jgi:hypothetical protein
MSKHDEVHGPGTDGLTGGAHRRRHGSAGPLIFALVALTLIFVSVVAAPAKAIDGLGIFDPKLGFVYLGDIWTYDDYTGEATPVVKSGGRSIGHPSFSLDFNSWAYEERTFEGGSLHSTVYFEETVSYLDKRPILHVIKDAQSPAVSPDGRYCLFERYDAAGAPVLHLYDSLEIDTLELPGAFNGTWVPEGTGPNWEIIYNRNADTFPTNSGPFVRIMNVDGEMPVSVTYPGETADQSNAWAPQASLGGVRMMFTKYVEPTGSPQVALLSADGLSELADVSKQDSFDYRWLMGTHLLPGHSPNEPFVELVPALGGRSDIYAIGPATSTPPPLIPRLEGCSFGWNASLPSESPFPDIHLGDPYYQAAAFMRVNQIISGLGDGTFGAGATSKRAQFAKMITGSLYLPAYDGMALAPFTDLGPNLSPLYPREYVSAAYQAGLIEGVDATHFNPYGTVTRAQVMTMVVRAAKVFALGHLEKIPTGWTGQLSGFTDPTHGANAHLAECNGLLEGIDLTGWNAWSPATRGEMAQMLFNLMMLRGPLVEPAPAY